jgi:hypothetical protein
VLGLRSINPPTHTPSGRLRWRIKVDNRNDKLLVLAIHFYVSIDNFASTCLATDHCSPLVQKCNRNQDITFELSIVEFKADKNEE